MRHARRQQMAQDAAKKQRNKKRRSPALISGLAAFFFAAGVFFAGYQALVHPDTPLPRAWNPVQPLVISDPVTPITSWKLDRTAADFKACQAALAPAAVLDVMEPLEDSEQCFITDRVTLRSIGGVTLAPLETRCAIALRTAMWMEHSVQPAAAGFLGQPVTGLAHIGSYNCRAMRTSSGVSQRMSTHATADAIDIAGFNMADGGRIRLLDHWDDTSGRGAFLQAVRDGACDWFSLTLSPDYNRLHADHFHLQSRGWGLCR